MAEDPPEHEHHYLPHRPHGAFGEGLVARVAERVADAMGTVQFVIISTLAIAGWLVVNDVGSFLRHALVGLRHGRGFDPAPFILLNLVFSAVAYYSASMVMIAQKVQVKRDHAHAVDAVEHHEQLARDQADLLRANTELTQRVHDLSVEIHALVSRPLAP
ncbi:MAG: DUF1003 domain-containing protein [Thermoleophilia bacterium]|nr:DUF1003 domain-containing protein [Thermoleophilia bacterium]